MSDQGDQRAGILAAVEMDRPAWPDRPWVVSTMIASLNGAIAIDGRSGPLGNDTDRALLLAMRRVCDAILVGASTARGEGYRPSSITHLQIVVASRTANEDWDAALWHDSRTTLLTCDAAVRRVPAHVTTLVAGDDSLDLPHAMHLLRDRGIERLDCEGGPRLNGAMIESDLFDELSLTVAPLIVGGAHTGPVAGAPAGIATRGFRLVHALPDDDHLFLRYLRDRDRNV